MENDNSDKKFEPYKIPRFRQAQSDRADELLPQTKETAKDHTFNGIFYEIEYDPAPTAGTSGSVPKSQKIEPPEKDRIRELFYEMRDIARQHQSPAVYYSKFFDKRIQQNNARIFYEQALFMKDFEDDYPEQVQFSSYFPYYQMLGYKQLRTYFTWRTKVRKGIVGNISLSYAFLYIYELINNIDEEYPKDNFDKLLSFWRIFRNYDSSIDKYVLRWIKDYYIYYDLPKTFKEFAEEYGLAGYYPELKADADNFDLFCSISKYDIRRSGFFTAETSKLITECFNNVLNKIRQDFEAAGMNFDDVFFRPKRTINWNPFKDALFYHHIYQPDRKVIISEDEIYICSNNQWTYSTSITTEKGKQFIGYVMKQMESILRKLTKYKFKITANIDMIHPDTISKLQSSGLYIDEIVQYAVTEFYNEATKIVVTVDRTSLARIRQEALKTQESLIVEEQSETSDYISAQSPQSDQTIFSDIPKEEPSPISDVWENLKGALTEIELNALSVILQGCSIKKFADDHSIMLEVLADGINEKAMDYIGDNVLDDELAIYGDYEKQVKGMIE